MARPKKQALPYYKANDVIKAATKSDDMITSLFKDGTDVIKIESRSSAGRLHGSTAYCPRHESLASNFSWETRLKPAAALYQGVGVGVEKALQDGLLMSGGLMANNIKIPASPDINFGGEVDAIVLADEKLWVLEIKTIGTLPVQPLIKHRFQALTYSLFTGLPARIIYVSRSIAKYYNGADGQQVQEVLMKEFELPFNHATLKSVAHTLFLGHLYSDALKLAPIPSGFSETVHCKYCPFVPMCWKGEPAPLVETKPVLVDLIDRQAKDAAIKFVDDLEMRRNEFINHMINNGTALAYDALSDGRYINHVTNLYINESYRK